MFIENSVAQRIKDVKESKSVLLRKLLASMIIRIAYSMQKVKVLMDRN